jgi:hypothetical protein
VPDTEIFRHLNRAICTAIIDDEYFYDIYAVNSVGQIIEGLRQRAFLIETGNLDDQFDGSVYGITLVFESFVRC